MEKIVIDTEQFQALYNKEFDQCIVRVPCEIYHAPNQICFDYRILL